MVDKKKELHNESGLYVLDAMLHVAKQKNSYTELVHPLSKLNQELERYKLTKKVDPREEADKLSERLHGNVIIVRDSFDPYEIDITKNLPFSAIISNPSMAHYAEKLYELVKDTVEYVYSKDGFEKAQNSINGIIFDAENSRDIKLSESMAEGLVDDLKEIRTNLKNASTIRYSSVKLTYSTLVKSLKNLYKELGIKTENSSVLRELSDAWNSYSITQEDLDMLRGYDDKGE